MYNIHSDGLVKMRMKKEINEKIETTDVVAAAALFIYIFGREKDTFKSN